ncbi:Protein of unknown function (DUF1415) [Seminavis robusta]|uniref:Uncharacterized protein n=1 Tax=Seminavis robusta TaxID=568900 RepID=A0A9N8F004_9STRA|nr:Protein of unknown function (DUF1415) [Seminavis robusta]|eukprot:Sro2380_g325460.1 Protein of unknown function (DUF1415) (370) ;mRNA; f:11605-12836
MAELGISTLLVCLQLILCLLSLGVDAFQSPPDTYTARSILYSTGNSPTSIDACPFSKKFPKYRIDLSRSNGNKKNEKPSWVPFLGDVQKSMDRGKLEQQFPQAVDWMDPEAAGISVFTRLWKSAVNLCDEAESTQRIIIGVSDAHHCGIAEDWVDILNWMQNEEALAPYREISLLATIHKEGQLVAVEITRQGGLSSAITSSDAAYDPKTLNRRTQAWVKRILVDQGICPFTKSVKVSGQGLGDLGIPVAKIHYCSSNASCLQICRLMADTWEEIAFMLEMGPSGKDGISSILLAAPEYDNNFDLWSGPIFAMLETGVVACRLQKQVGVVCFHPMYATPDGSSFPGFGHMHSGGPVGSRRRTSYHGRAV